MNNYHIEFYAHANLTVEKLGEIINIKMKQWQYSKEEHLDWMHKNISSNDLHALLYLDTVPVAYANLIDIVIERNTHSLQGWGLGNVCAIERGKGYGIELMEYINQYIHETDRLGVLFCKQPLLKFYSSLNWVHLQSHQYEILNLNCDVMVYNCDLDKGVIKYNGTLF